MTLLDWARLYLARGWRVVPIPAGQKAARAPGWQKLDLRLANLPQHFGSGGNVGVILGAASGELVDMDLDCPEALALADLYLPATRATFGRPSKPGSHRLYVAPDAAYQGFADPQSGGTLLELRAAGRDGGAHATLFPPSVADGESRKWLGDTVAPTVIAAPALRIAAAWLAIGCLVCRYVGETPARKPSADLPNLLWEADRAFGRRAFDWLGLPHPDAPRRYPRPRHELNRTDLDLAELVHAIPNGCSWEEWNEIGMAIFAASGGSEDGLIAFDDFSAKSQKYDPRAVQERWRNYRRSPPSRTGIGKLAALAVSAGWRPSGRREPVQ